MSQERPRPLPEKSTVRILVVEDKQKHADLIQAWLEPEGYQLQLARSRDEALEALRRSPPDLVVLDLMLSLDTTKKEGYEVCRLLRQDPKTASIPVLMFTVLDLLEEIERGVEVDADDYLVKLSSKEEVCFRIECLLRVRHIKSKARRMIEYLRLLERGRPEGSAGPGTPEPRGPAEDA